MANFPKNLKSPLWISRQKNLDYQYTTHKFPAQKSVAHFNIFQLHNFTRNNQHEKMGLKQSSQFSLFYKNVENEDEHQHSICAVYTIQVEFEATGKTGICNSIEETKD